MDRKARLPKLPSAVIIVAGLFLFIWRPIVSGQRDDFYLYQLQVYCSDPQVATAIFTVKGTGSMGTKVICAGKCSGRTVSFEEALQGLSAGVTTGLKAELQKHEVKAAAGMARSLANCGSVCDASKYDDYLRKRQVAMELFKHASDLRLTASKLVAEQWKAEAANLRIEGEKEVAGDLAWDDFGRHVQRGMRESRGALKTSWLAKRGVPFAIKSWNAIGWIAEAVLISRRAIGTAADYKDYQKEAQEATKQAEEMWRKALTDLEEYLTRKCSDSQAVLPDEDRRRLERAKEAIEEWDNNQNLYLDPIRNEAVTFSEAVRRANEYLKSGKISRIPSEPAYVIAAFSEFDDPPSKRSLQAAINELDKAIPSWDRLSGSISKYLSTQRSIELKLESAFGITGTPTGVPKTPAKPPKTSVRIN